MDEDDESKASFMSHYEQKAEIEFDKGLSRLMNSESAAIIKYGNELRPKTQQIRRNITLGAKQN